MTTTQEPIDSSTNENSYETHSERPNAKCGKVSMVGRRAPVNAILGIGCS
jgi:hypothetical protein